MKLSNLIAVLCVVGLAQYGCGGGQTAVSPKSSLAAELNGAPMWVQTGGCPNGQPAQMICSVSSEKAEDAEDLSLARKTATANARAEVVQQLKTEVASGLNNFNDKYKTKVNGKRATEMTSRTQQAVEAIAKMDLHGSKPIASWISPSNMVYVAVSLDGKTALEAMKKNAAVGDAIKKAIDENAESMFNRMRKASK